MARGGGVGQAKGDKGDKSAALSRLFPGKYNSSYPAPREYCAARRPGEGRRQAGASGVGHRRIVAVWRDVGRSNCGRAKVGPRLCCECSVSSKGFHTKTQRREAVVRVAGISLIFQRRALARTWIEKRLRRERNIFAPLRLRARKLLLIALQIGPVSPDFVSPDFPVFPDFRWQAFRRPTASVVGITSLEYRAPVVALVLRLVVALALALTPVAMVSAMPSQDGSAAVHQGMADCPTAPKFSPDTRCAYYCFAGLAASDAVSALAGARSLELCNFSHRAIGAGIEPRVADPPPR